MALKAWGVRFKPDLQAKLDELAMETGRPTGELVEDVVAGYLDELVHTREVLNSPYDDLKSGTIQPIDGEEAFARLKAKTEQQRNSRARPGAMASIRKPMLTLMKYVDTSPPTP